MRRREPDRFRVILDGSIPLPQQIISPTTIDISECKAGIEADGFRIILNRRIIPSGSKIRHALFKPSS